MLSIFLFTVCSMFYEAAICSIFSNLVLGFRGLVIFYAHFAVCQCARATSCLQLVDAVATADKGWLHASMVVTSAIRLPFTSRGPLAISPLKKCYDIIFYCFTCINSCRWTHERTGVCPKTACGYYENRHAVSGLFNMSFLI